jgi:hypothetical protein
MFGKKKQEQGAAGGQQQKVSYFAIKPESILKNEIPLDALAEPYVLIHARRQKLGEIMYVVNLLARRAGYKINSFSVSRFFAYVIVEKTTTTATTSPSTTAAAVVERPPPPTIESLEEEEE